MGTKTDNEIRGIVSDILQSYSDHASICQIGSASQPSRDVVIDVLKKLKCLVFPGYFETKKLKEDSIDYYVGELVEEVIYDLNKQIRKALLHSGKEDIPEGYEEELTAQFMRRLPWIRECLATDVQAAFDGDPAAFSVSEIIFSYPGVFAIMVNRIAHELHLLSVPLIPRIMTEYAHNLTGIDIHPGATIGKYFFIDHGTGIVIGETTEIGDHVKIYQGVTLGALSTRGGQSLKETKRHPTIEDNVTIYSGASILGGKTVIGRGSVIGSNAFITTPIPAETRVSIKTAELQLKNRNGDSVPESEFDDFQSARCPHCPNQQKPETTI